MTLETSREYLSVGDVLAHRIHEVSGVHAVAKARDFATSVPQKLIARV